MKKKSAIIGFSKDADSFSFNRGLDLIKIDKPSDSECGEKACVCLCNGEYKLKDKKLDGKFTSFGECGREYICKELKHDIVQKTILKT
ncbi:MAG: hypothetical protein IIA99_07235 [Proteobacteria bacterium]|nr:hypothetical protein [Pseudomonadota bacterium]